MKGKIKETLKGYDLVDTGKYFEIPSFDIRINYRGRITIRYQKDIHKIYYQEGDLLETVRGCIELLEEDLSYESFKKRCKMFPFDAGEYHWKLELDTTGEDDLYFIVCGGSIKIGRTKDIRKRIKQLKTSFSKSYEAYVIPEKGFMERKYHHVYSELRLEGEWFKENIQILEFLDRRLKEGSAYLFNEEILKEEREDTKKLSINCEMPFGKYEGILISELVKNNPPYLIWLRDNYEKYDKKFNKELRNIIAKLS